MFNIMATADSEAMAILRQRIRAIIEARNLTIKEVAQSSGITRESLSRMLTGHYDCTVVNAEKIAKTLGYNSLYELLSPESFDQKIA